ncbi:LysM peptidoglycan-binding domain-containing protein [Thalassotalea euphylliae]|uniref:LysM peptidoglycan-binding domain-containing protein n=1 Tax=Thalassotalea euphylliae TaxID=1655234 RepID=A0A3E0TUS9_9GAMM|nr:peptidoglycan-binding protein [Thalassotalea euphylliae]REL27692.1 LysM peptidoglycan-binding domain-containing protein [Thalassotalea euphylliae]
MPKNYKVKQGDSIVSIAYRHGFLPDTLWNHSANRELKSKRENMNTLAPGDMLVIPDIDTTAISCASDQKHKFRRKGTPIKVTLKLIEEDEPRANLEYTLVVDGQSRQGTSDGNGVVEEYVLPTAKKGVLKIGDTEQVTLDIGHLNPSDDLTGAQSRLNNLGYFCGSSDKLDEQTKAAIRGFQGDNDLEQTGELDQATKDKLMEAHGG